MARNRDHLKRRQQDNVSTASSTFYRKPKPKAKAKAKAKLKPNLLTDPVAKVYGEKRNVTFRNVFRKYKVTKRRQFTSLIIFLLLQ